VCNREASIMRPWPTRGCPAMTKKKPYTGFLLRHSLYKLNRIGDKQHLCLTPLPRLHTSCLPFVQLYSNTLIHVKKGIRAVINEPLLTLVKFSKATDRIRQHIYIHTHAHATWQQVLRDVIRCQVHITHKQVAISHIHKG
jgi:hypothetical protein